MTLRLALCCVLLLTGLVTRPLFAAPAQNKVIDIGIEGLRRVGREAALSTIGTHTGDGLDPEMVTRDLRAIWATGLFRDVRAEQEVVPDGVRLIFVVVEKPSIHSVQFVGRDDISEDDIKGVTDVKPFTILNVELLKRNVEKIKDLYVGKGYYLAEVKYRVEPSPGLPDEVDVFFDIKENSKVVVKQITIIGNEKVSDDEIKSVLQTREGNELSFLNQSGTYKEEYFQTDLFRIQALYYDRGFVTVKVGEPTSTISQDRRFIYLSIPLEEGLQYNIGKITFAGELELRDPEGHVLVDESRLREKLAIKSGALFNRTHLFNDIQNLTDAYRDYGYANANVTPNSHVNPETREVDLEMEVERGDVVHIERIEIVGNTRTRDKVIRRELRIHEGDRFSASLINSSRARVTQLGFFESVNITQTRGSRPDLMTLSVEVKEKSTGTFQVGAGLSSVESFIATAQISQNNFLGNGQMLSLQARLSFGTYARQIATVQFYEPYFLDTMWSLGMNAYLTQANYQDFLRNSKGFSPSLGYPITHELRVSLGYTLESIQISTNYGGTGYTPALRNLNRNGISSAVNASIFYDTRDNRLFPTKGQYHELQGEISNPALGSDVDMQFKRIQFTARAYHPLFWKFVFKFKGEMGWVFGGGPYGVPISERYFPGGIYSVRGYDLRGLGPRVQVGNLSDPSSSTNQFIVGGDKQVVMNYEIEFPIVEAAGIKGVLFADAGNAFNDDESLFYAGQSSKPPAYLIRSGRKISPPLGLYYATGFGLRWFSPIGPLRFEWGIPITKRHPTDRNIVFQFTIGNFF